MTRGHLHVGAINFTGVKTGSLAACTGHQGYVGHLNRHIGQAGAAMTRVLMMCCIENFP